MSSDMAAGLEAAPLPTGRASSLRQQVYVGARRRLPPDSLVFEWNNVERQLQHAAVQVPAEGQAELLRAMAMAAPGRAGGEAPKCSVCGAGLPTPHLLDLHMAETHDSFFAAQVARKHKVFQCLLETCSRKFATMAERKQHLIDAHCFPKSFDFERMHMRCHKGQVRPAEQLRHFKPKPVRRAHPTGTAAAAAPGSAGTEAEQQRPADHLAEELSGLSVHGEPTYPELFSFGRSRRLAPMRGRGRGRRDGRGRGRGPCIELD